MGLPIVAGALQCRLTGHTLYPEHRAIFCLVRPDQTGGLNAGHRVPSESSTGSEGLPLRIGRAIHS